MLCLWQMVPEYIPGPRSKPTTHMYCISASCQCNLLFFQISCANFLISFFSHSLFLIREPTLFFLMSPVCWVFTRGVAYSLFTSTSLSQHMRASLVQIIIPHRARTCSFYIRHHTKLSFDSMKISIFALTTMSTMMLLWVSAVLTHIIITTNVKKKWASRNDNNKNENH